MIISWIISFVVGFLIGYFVIGPCLNRKNNRED